MATKFITPSWRMPKNSNQSKASNYSIDFDTTDTIVPTNAPSINLSSHTVSVWVKPNSSAFSKGISNIHCNQRLWYLSILANETGVRYQIASTLDSTTAVSTTEWTHIVASHDTDTNIWKIFQNGVLTATQTVNVNIGNWGGSNNKIGSSFDGKMANFAIFDYALSSNATTVGDIASGAVGALYNGGIPSNPLAVTTPPVAYYDLGQGSAYAEGSAGIVEPNLAQATGTTVFDFEQASSQNIDIGSSTLFDSTSTFAFSTWCKLESYDNSFPAFIRLKTDQSTGFIMGFSNYDATYYGVWFGSSSNFLTAKTAGNISADLLGVWKHICLVYDGVDRTAISSYSLYINGVPQSLVSAGSFGATSNTNLIGQGNTASTFWDGELSNTQIWDTNLSSPEITTLYNNGTPLQSNIPQSGSLKAWYKLGLDTSVYDTTNTRWAIEDSTTPYNGTINFQI